MQTIIIKPTCDVLYTNQQSELSAEYLLDDKKDGGSRKLCYNKVISSGQIIILNYGNSF